MAAIERRNIEVEQVVGVILNIDSSMPSQRIGVVEGERSAFLQTIDDECREHLANYQQVLSAARELDMQLVDKIRKPYGDSGKKIGGVAGSIVGAFISVFLPEVKVVSTLLQVLYKAAPILITGYAGYNLGESIGKAVAERQHPNVERVIAGIWQREMRWIAEKIAQASALLRDNQRRLDRGQGGDETDRIQRDITQIRQFIGFYGEVLERVNELTSEIFATAAIR